MGAPVDVAADLRDLRVDSGDDAQFRCTALPHPRLRLVPAQVTGLTRRMPLVSRPAEGLPRRSAHLTLVPRAQFVPTADAVPA